MKKGMMNICVDESGTFVSSPVSGAWNVTGGLIIPGPEKKECNVALNRLKCISGYKVSDEIKLKNVSEINYIKFLKELGKTKCTFYGVATDSGKATDESVIAHRDAQAIGVESNKGIMEHEAGRIAVENLASQLRQLSPQLYAQLTCQAELINDLIDRGISYYVQRIPKQLNGFRWEIDEKLAGQSNFEKTFRTILPPLLQSRSLREPHLHLTDCDYSSMLEYFYTQENKPTYLEEYYNIEIKEKMILNVGKLIWSDFEFVDSKESEGVQIVDLLASGLRRCLRGQFEANLRVASHLGALMVQVEFNKSPVRLVSLTEVASVEDDNVVQVIDVLTNAQKNFLR